MFRASLGKVVHTLKRAGTYAVKVPPQELHKIAVHVRAVVPPPRTRRGAHSPAGEGWGSPNSYVLRKALRLLCGPLDVYSPNHVICFLLRRRRSAGVKMRGIIDKVLQRNDPKSKSCDDLYVL